MPAGNATSDYRGDVSGNHWHRGDLYLVAALVSIAVLRSLAIVISPLELGVDEAQYWLWSQNFDFGYFTKPPLTSWIIGLTHAVFGHHDWAVRLAAPWLHLATSLVLWRGAGWLYGASAGRWAGILWTLLPATSLGSFVISTDTPLLLFWALALTSLAGIITGKISPDRGMFLAGLAAGIGMLAKYAAIYFPVGVIIFWVWQRLSSTTNSSTTNSSATNPPTANFPASDAAQPESVQHITGRIAQIHPGHLVLLAIGMGLAASPNLIWNLFNDFATVRHLGDNANLAKQSHSLASSLDFLGAQFVTAGPICFALMLLILRPPLSDPRHRLLLSMAMPPLAIITLQAFLSEANANWALAAMPALVIWLSGWIARQHHRWGQAAAGINAIIAALFLVASTAGSLGPLTPDSDPLRRLRGWQVLAADVNDALAQSGANTVIADRRATAALLMWHFHNTDINVYIHDADGIPGNHFEANHAWQPVAGRHIIWLDGRSVAPAIDGVEWQRTEGISKVDIARNVTRTLYLHKGVETAR
ncbi:MAG: glycosyltransferase family 39 protein [Alphaproteobacteria bacterium]